MVFPTVTNERDGKREKKKTHTRDHTHTCTEYLLGTARNVSQ